MPSDVTSIATYVAAFVFVIALIAIGAWLLKGLTGGGSGNKTGSFLRGRERRLGVVEAANVDGRRKLILLRRDDTEHLIMTGGPVDVVIETGIKKPLPAEPSFGPERNDDRVIIAHDEHHSPPGRTHEQD
jgi:flagellar protein FliO/FliZ